jgi:signal peptidase I
MGQNDISNLIVSVITVIMISLIIAMFSPHMKHTLVRLKLLEKDETPGSLLAWIIGIIIIVKIFQAFLIQPFIVEGTSMLSTFKDKEFLLVNKIGYFLESPVRGQVIVFKLNEQGFDRYLIKRIIGLPGERVVINNGVTTIYNKENPNGFILDEPYVTFKDATKPANVTLAEDEYFVMGDNRVVSYDSRIWGALHAVNIRGEALVRILPLGVFSIHPGSYVFEK